jgi:hypothetical protein
MSSLDGRQLQAGGLREISVRMCVCVREGGGGRE